MRVKPVTSILATIFSIQEALAFSLKSLGRGLASLNQVGMLANQAGSLLGNQGVGHGGLPPENQDGNYGGMPPMNQGGGHGGLPPTNQGASPAGSPFLNPFGNFAIQGGRRESIQPHVPSPTSIRPQPHPHIDSAPWPAPRVCTSPFISPIAVRKLRDRYYCRSS